MLGRRNFPSITRSSKIRKEGGGKKAHRTRELVQSGESGPLNRGKRGTLCHVLNLHLSKGEGEVVTAVRKKKKAVIARANPEWFTYNQEEKERKKESIIPERGEK